MGLNYYVRHLGAIHANDIARKYSVGVGNLTHNRHVRLIENLVAFANRQDSIETVLDCPCGSGRLSKLFTTHKLTCADRNPRRIAETRSELAEHDVAIDICDVLNLPYRNRQFDLVLCVLLFQHIASAQVQAAMDELARVANKWVVLTFSDRWAGVNRVRTAGISRSSSKTRFSMSELEKFSVRAGLALTLCEPVWPVISGTKFALLKKRRFS